MLDQDDGRQGHFGAHMQRDLSLCGDASHPALLQNKLLCCSQWTLWSLDGEIFPRHPTMAGLHLDFVTTSGIRPGRPQGPGFDAELEPEPEPEPRP